MQRILVMAVSHHRAKEKLFVYCVCPRMVYIVRVQVQMNTHKPRSCRHSHIISIDICRMRIHTHTVACTVWWPLLWIYKMIRFFFYLFGWLRVDVTEKKTESHARTRKTIHSQANTHTHRPVFASRANTNADERHKTLKLEYDFPIWQLHLSNMESNAENTHTHTLSNKGRQADMHTNTPTYRMANAEKHTYSARIPIEM